MMPGAHVVIFLTVLIENWPYVDEGVAALAVDVMTCDELSEDEVDGVVPDEAGEEAETMPIKPG
jgi:hypothetical protein